MTIKATPCFCCSEKPFSQCCEPVINDHAKAINPMILMRSRYSAYVIRHERHLLATWAPSSRPATLDLADGKTKWLGLVVHSHSTISSDEDTGEVDFTAKFLNGDQLCELREKSRFIRHGGLWFYLDGENDTDCITVARNGSCPCGSGKKFKRCCLAG